jgi:hypothetical protein
VAIVAVRQWHWGQEKGDGVGGSARVWPALRHPNRVTWRCYKTKCRVEEDNNYFETKVTKNECQTISKKVTRIIFIYWSQISYISFHCDIIFALLKAESSILHGFFMGREDTKISLRKSSLEQTADTCSGGSRILDKGMSFKNFHTQFSKAI